MNTLRTSPLLAFALRLDAVATAASAIGLLLFTERLQALFNLPALLMTGAGVFMLAYAAVVAWLSQRDALPRWAVWTVIIGNTVWALECAMLAFGDLVAPSTLGVTFLLVQALFVVGFAELQYLGMKRSSLAAAA